MKYVKMDSFGWVNYTFITPHTQCELGKVIGRGVHIYIQNLVVDNEVI